jgi:hypothetical protein
VTFPCPGKSFFLEEKKGRREDAGRMDFDGEETLAAVGNLEVRTGREDAGLA